MISSSSKHDNSAIRACEKSSLKSNDPRVDANCIGRGGVLTRDVKGFIAAFKGEKISPAEYEELPPQQQGYAVALGIGMYLNCYKSCMDGTCTASLVNSPWRSNKASNSELHIGFVEGEWRASLYTMDNILLKEGTELFYSYGRTYKYEKRFGLIIINKIEDYM